MNTPTSQSNTKQGDIDSGTAKAILEVIYII